MARINTTDPSASVANTTPPPTNVPVIGVLATAETVNSRHTLETLTTLWGNGAIATPGAGPSYTLECTSCHDPHGNGNYRILRSVPTGSSGAGTPTPVPVTIADQVGTKVYATDNYFNTGPVSGIQMASWCATCHTRYLASSTGVNSGDAIFTYRHRSNGSLAGTTCIKCHASHGSNASMPGLYSSTVPWPGGGSGTTDDNNSRLLKMDNRGICIKCHWGY